MSEPTREAVLAEVNAALDKLSSYQLAVLFGVIHDAVCVGGEPDYAALHALLERWKVA